MRKLLAATIAAGVIATGLMASVSPAHAATKCSGSPSNNTCVYTTVTSKTTTLVDSYQVSDGKNKSNVTATCTWTSGTTVSLTAGAKVTVGAEASVSVLELASIKASVSAEFSVSTTISKAQSNAVTISTVVRPGQKVWCERRIQQVTVSTRTETVSGSKVTISTKSYSLPKQNSWATVFRWA